MIDRIDHVDIATVNSHSFQVNEGCMDRFSASAERIVSGAALKLASVFRTPKFHVLFHFQCINEKKMKHGASLVTRSIQPTKPKLTDTQSYYISINKSDNFYTSPTLSALPLCTQFHRRFLHAHLFIMWTRKISSDKLHRGSLCVVHKWPSSACNDRSTENNSDGGNF